MSRAKRQVEIARLLKKKAWYRLTTRLELWLAEDPSWRDEMLWTVGWAHLHLATSSKDIDKAAKDLRQALKQNTELSSIVPFERFEVWPGTTGELEVYILLSKAQVAGQSGRWKQAVKLTQVAVEQDPECMVALHRLGAFAREDGQFQVALDAYSALIDRDPENGPYARRILTLQNLGDYEQVLEDVDRLLVIQPGEELQHRLTRGDALLELGRLPEAEAEFQQCLDIDPDSASAHLGLGHLYRAQGDQAQMQRAWQRAVDIGCPSAERALREHG